MAEAKGLDALIRRTDDALPVVTSERALALRDARVELEALEFAAKASLDSILRRMARMKRQIAELETESPK
jgi:hypothetical protein